MFFIKKLIKLIIYEIKKIHKNGLYNSTTHLITVLVVILDCRLFVERSESGHYIKLVLHPID